MDEKKDKQEGVPLVGLVSKVKEISGTMPIIKKLFSKQVELESYMRHFMDYNQGQFLTVDHVDVKDQRLRDDVMKMVIERVDKHTKAVDEKMKIFAIEEDVTERLEFKSNKYDYGEVKRQIAGLLTSLNPLLQGHKQFTLEKFIEQVNKMEINELNAREFDRQISVLKSSITDQAFIQ